MHLSVKYNSVKELSLINDNRCLVAEKSNNLEKINLPNFNFCIYLIQIENNNLRISKK